MDPKIEALISKAGDGNLCLVDSATTHTILKEKKFFLTLSPIKVKINTISRSINLIEGSGRATIMLNNETKLSINDTLYSSRSRRNLLSFKDIRKNGYHLETINENSTEFICITSNTSGRRLILEKLSTLLSGLYYTIIKAIESYAVSNQKFVDPKAFMLWHDRLGHPRSTIIRRIIENSHGHTLQNHKILLSSEQFCIVCSQGKLVIRPSPSKIGGESPSFL